MAAFSRDDAPKTKETILYERNTARGQVHRIRLERDDFIGKFTDASTFALRTTKQLVIDTHGLEPTKAAYWAALAKWGEPIAVFTKHTTGEKTHRARVVVARKVKGSGGGWKNEEIDAHCTPDGDYYKPWAEGDEPAFFMKKMDPIPENFTMDDMGELVPIKRY